ncbi:hypothetical protein [Sorangium sp. So ce861]|uniref:hypothetical protein n=1 Tax=Sorangium sp. So ce861 TaxID=3133323 RepID=UPI003F6432CE
MATATPIDMSRWPIVHYEMPEHVPDDEAPRHVDVFNGVLERNEPFVLIFSGAEMPSKSMRFLRLYDAWSKRNFAAQKRLCRGAVRVEPDAGKRSSLWRKALLYVTSSRSPYPYRIVATVEEAQSQARAWLGLD